MGDETTLYRMYGKYDELLYVGVTSTVRGATRFTEHTKRKWWWPQVVSLTVEHYMTREAAESAERRAIQDEGPLYNIVHNRQPYRPTPPGPMDPSPTWGGGHAVRAAAVADAIATKATNRAFILFDDALGEVVQLLIGLGRADEPCIDCGALTQPHSWDVAPLHHLDGHLMALYRCRRWADHPGSCWTWWEQPRSLPEVENVYGIDEMVLLRDQLKAKAEHGAPMIAPEVEPVLAGLAARWPRVD